MWDGMTQEEEVIAQTVISGEKDWVIWSVLGKQNRLKVNWVRMLPGTKSTKNGLPSGVWYEARGSTASRVKVPKKVRKWVWRRLHKKEGLVSSE